MKNVLFGFTSAVIIHFGFGFTFKTWEFYAILIPLAIFTNLYQ